VLNGGRIGAIEHQQASGHVSYDFLPSYLMMLMGADFGAWRGSLIHYDVPLVRTKAWLSDLPIRTGWWRGLGLLANTFALESSVAELAHRARADPRTCRVDHLPESAEGRRLAGVLQRAAERGGWGTVAPEGRARGIACCVDSNTAVAHVAEVSIEDGRPRVHRVSAAVDAGLIVNPDGAMAQVQGGIAMGLSSALLEEITVRDGQLSAANFDAYPILGMRDMPEIGVDLIESSETPYGLGEPPMGPAAAAVANALFALTGKRLRQLPLRIEQA
jgi:isoquinoline 1-oxidoreductase beta subunit